MKRFLIVCLCWIGTLFAFQNLPYMNLDRNQFSFSLFAENYSNDSDLFFLNNQLFFNFDNLAYGFSVYPIRIPKNLEIEVGEVEFSFDRITIDGVELENNEETVVDIGTVELNNSVKSLSIVSHHFVWEPFDFVVPYIKSEMQIQLGYMNVGFPESYDNVSEIIFFDRHFYEQFITWRFRPFNQAPFYVYSSLFKSKFYEDYQQAFALSFERKNASFSIVHLLEKELTSIFCESHLFGGLFAKVGIYPIEDQLKKFLFRPKYFLTFEFRSKMRSSLNENKKLNKKKLLRPLDVDKASLIDMEKGSLAYFNGEFREALLCYERVVMKYPNLSLAWERLGSIYYELKLYKQAKMAWEKVLDYEPENQDINFYLDKLSDELRITIPGDYQDENIDLEI